MKKILITSLLSSFLYVIGLHAQDARQDFTIVNATGFAIDELYASPVGSEDWGEDILGKEILPDEQECDIIFQPEEDICLWDIRIVDEEGDEVEWENIDLCKAIRVILYWKNGKAWADVEEVEE